MQGLRQTKGLFYYEIELLKLDPPCYPQFGFAGSNFKGSSVYESTGVGDDAISWAVDGERMSLWHGSSRPWATDGAQWKEGDVIGIACDLDEGTMQVSVNGEWDAGSKVFDSIRLESTVGEWLFPAFSGKGLQARCNFEPGSLRYLPPMRLLFPGEVGDAFLETLIIFTFHAGSDVAAKAAEAKLTDKDLTDRLKPSVDGGEARGAQASAVRDVTEAVLRSDEEQARGVRTLSRRACLEWEVRSERVVRVAEEEMDAEVKRREDALGAGMAVVGVVLPMPRARAEDRLDAAKEALLALAGLPGPWLGSHAVFERTVRYHEVASVADLRKRLGELSSDELKKKAAESWGVEGAGKMGRKEILAAVADEFVRRHLQEDLRAALAAAADGEAAVRVLEGAWGAEAPAAALSSWSERVAAVVGRLDSERRFEEVAGWLGMLQCRMQGRTRLGLAALRKARQREIDEYKLQEGEVLSLHLYTGPEFVVMNAICRDYPPEILRLLRGAQEGARNTLSTTLFCVTSGLKKLAQGTELPASGTVYRGLGARQHFTACFV